MIRTTISLEEPVLRAVKRVARDSHRSLGETITELLQVGLRERGKKIVPGLSVLPDFNMGSAMVSLEDKDRLHQLLDGGKF